MQPSHSLAPIPPRAAELVLRLARQLHRAAISDSLRVSLPVLRRILSTHTLRDLSLPQLHKQRAMVQRKHLLRTLAVEAGYPSWERYRQALPGMSADQLLHLDLLHATAGYPNLWFSTRAQAQDHAQMHGGHVVSVGAQAVVLMPESPHN